MNPEEMGMSLQELMLHLALNPYKDPRRPNVEQDGINNAFSIPLATIINVSNADLCTIAPSLRETITLQHMMKLYDTENVYEGE